MENLQPKGITISRHFTTEDQDPMDQVEWISTSSTMKGDEGEALFEMEGIEAPAAWSQRAIDIVASKYFKRAASINGGLGERSVRDLILRVVDTIAEQGKVQGYFRSPEDGKAFRDELCHLLINQMAAFNSPVFFNAGLYEKYGLTGTASGGFHWGIKEEKPIPTEIYFQHPQLSACFIQSIKDDLSDIAQHVWREMMIFKSGAGSGSSYSSLRAKGEPLKSGGTSSGLISFLEVFDRAAGSTKSGGTTRRAAKMVVLNADHPEIFDFVNWKAREEEKARILIQAGVSGGMNGEAYHTVSGQNSNNSVRVTDEFMEAVIADTDWNLKWVTTGEVARTVKANELMNAICQASWACADPAVQFDTTINAWDTTPFSGRIEASNPCGEYFGKNDSACNLASTNLAKFLGVDGAFDIESFKHACRTLIVAQDILIDYSSYPTEKICENSHSFRPLGLGYGNLGGLLMRMGVPYDSEQGRAIAAAITSIMTATAYEGSADMGEGLTPFSHYQKRNKAAMRKVIEKHRRAALGINEKACPDHLFSAAWEAWEAVLERAKNSQGGFRNSLVSVLAPTGTISFLMSCDTTGVEPAFALVATKKLVGGGSLKMINESVESSLGTLGYSPDQIEDIRVHMLGHGHLPHNGSETGVCVSRLRNLGFADEVIDRVNRTIPGCTDINCAFSMVPEAVAMIDLFASRAGRGDTSGLPILQKMGFSPEEVEEANLYACGRMTMEGGPHLRPEHLAVFDCASPCPPYGKRSISPMGHVNMVAAVQPFLSGGVSKTISLPSSATPADIREIYIDAWRKGLKGVTVYRDGSKAAQPLSSGTEASEQSETKPCSRKRMPVERKGGRTVGVKIDGHRLYVTANPFEDGSLGEIFIVADKPTSLLGGFLNCFAKLVSIALQHGVSLLKLVEAFTFEQFDPQGFTTHPTFTMCKSIPDWIFRWLALEFLGDDSYAQVKPEKDPDALPAPKKVHPQTPVVNGKTCPKCGSVKLVRTGTCLACAECGESVGGCS